MVIAAAGPDDIVAGLGDDDVNAGSGDDFIVGDTGDVGLLSGGNRRRGKPADGDDVLDGGSGNDTIYGQGGDDEIIGGSGNDLIVGGSGRGHHVRRHRQRHILAGAGDVIDGGANADVIQVAGSWTDYRIVQNGDGSLTFTSIANPSQRFTVSNVEDVTFDNGADADTTNTMADAIDNAPTIAGLTNSPVLENSATGVVVASFTVADLDLGAIPALGDSLTVTLLNDGGVPFTVVSTGPGAYNLVVDGAIDREALSSYSLTIEAKDLKGATTTQTITVNVGDVNDNAPVITNVNTAAVVARMAAPCRSSPSPRRMWTSSTARRPTRWAAPTPRGSASALRVCSPSSAPTSRAPRPAATTSMT